ncbi:MAG: deoxynucleoside kinase [Gammaproteobacteria bacterium]|nr:deoxynucleoside kinase [Gammaproteobacteria bacterium]MCW8986342.1 deoxynucleoside kinase [Gammaproteobacteria bacterium]MCW9032146.1 deoxynucleoside kinase [Gammaproteobacteria bacterium]
MSAAENKHGFIVVEGPVGVGKTTLAKRLAESFNTDLLLEGADENPFLNKFYENQKNVAFQTQLFFLFQRAQQMQDLRQTDMFRPVHVADFIMEKDRLFAELTLDEEEFKLYQQVYQHLTIDAPVPDLVIYLQAPVDVLRKRISQRGRSYEKSMDSDYLYRLNEGYARFFYNYTQSPLLIVNAEEIDLVSNENDYNLLLEQIKKVKSGRHYFNPISVSI